MAELEGSHLSPNTYKFGDLHTHSGYKIGSLVFDGSLQPEQIVDIAERQGQSFVAITDHDSIVPSVVARNYAEQRGRNVHVMIGAEISSSDGHIIGLDMKENVPFWMNAVDTVRAIHAQGGLAIAPHPLYRLTYSLGKKGLRSVAENEDPEIYWDGFEGMNKSANNWRRYEWIRRLSDGNRRARRLYNSEENRDLYGALVAGSDSHKDNIGQAVTIIPMELDIYTAIKTQNTDIAVTEEEDKFSIRKLFETDRRSREIEVFRSKTPTRLFPGIEVLPRAA